MNYIELTTPQDEGYEIFRGNQWALVNDIRSQDGVDAKHKRIAQAPPLPYYLETRVQANAPLILTAKRNIMTVEVVIEQFKKVAPGIYKEIFKFFDSNLVSEFDEPEEATVREIIYILMFSSAGFDFFIPRSQFLPWHYKHYNIARLDGTSPHGL